MVASSRSKIVPTVKLLQLQYVRRRRSWITCLNTCVKMIQATAVCHRFACCCEHQKEIETYQMIQSWPISFTPSSAGLCQKLLHCMTRDSGAQNCLQHRTTDIIFPTHKSPEIDKQATDSIFHSISDPAFSSLLTDCVYSQLIFSFHAWCSAVTHKWKINEFLTWKKVFSLVKSFSQ